jgi:hypothetical protein
VTLTLKSSDTPLAEQLDRLIASFRRLRRTPLWLRGCFASAATIEVTRNEETRRWHPHLHVLVKGKYIPHADLKDVWHRITKDSSIVDIRFIKDREKAIRYMAKYVTKPMSAGYDTEPDALAEAIEALKGRRLVLLTGEWHSLKVAIKDDDSNWQYVGTLQSIIERGLAGQPDALEILNHLKGGKECLLTKTGQPP